MGESRTWIRRLLPVAAIVLCAAAGPGPHGTPEEEILVGQLDKGGRVLLVGSDADGWGIRVETPGTASVRQLEPVRVKAYQSETEITDLTAGYRSVRKSGDGYVCVGDLSPVDGVVLRFEDTWSVAGALNLSRTVRVAGASPCGFFSAFTF